MSAEFDSQLEREKLDAMKELAYGASHEINNPLANISARAQTLLRDEQHPERRQALEAIRKQAMRAHEMISDLMLFARPPALNLQETNLDDLLNEIAAQFASECERRQVRLLVQLADQPTTIIADPQQLTVAIAAVCTNALEAIGENGTIEITLNLLMPDTDHITLQIMDTGAGMTDEVRRHLFDPFFSGREAGRGLGFGMSKCWRIVTDHGGTIAVSSQPNEGTTISIQLPGSPKSHTETQRRRGK